MRRKSSWCLWLPGRANAWGKFPSSSFEAGRESNLHPSNDHGRNRCALFTWNTNLYTEWLCFYNVQHLRTIRVKENKGIPHENTVIFGDPQLFVFHSTMRDRMKTSPAVADSSSWDHTDSLFNQQGPSFAISCGVQFSASLGRAARRLWQQQPRQSVIYSPGSTWSVCS